MKNLLLILFIAVLSSAIHGQPPFDAGEIPDPVLKIYPCKDSCNTINAIKSITSFAPETKWGKHPVIGSLKSYRIKLIRNEVVVEEKKAIVYNTQNNTRGYDIGDKTKSLLGKAQVGDVIIIDQIKVGLPDGTIRIIEAIKIEIE